MVNGQEYIEKNFPKNSKVINVTNKGLTGSLDLRKYSDLEELVIGTNQITDLVFSENNKNITKIEVYNNKLTNLNFLTALPNPERIKWLGLFQNQITANNLEVLAPFVNCEMLSIGKNNIRGNLISLRYWTKLKRLDMLGIKPQIHGLEYITHNPFDGVRGVSGEFFQDYTPKNAQEFNNNTWRGSRSGFRKLADEKVCETINNLRKQTQQLTKQLNQEKTNNQNLQQQNTQLASQLQQQTQNLNELFNMISPNSPYNFSQLKQEITGLKHQELAPQVREEKKQFEQLVTNAKNKVGNHFEKIVDLLLETHKQISRDGAESNEYHQAKGQLVAYQSILETNLTKEEVQTLLNKQTELLKLEAHLANLQPNQELHAQIQQT